MHSEHQRDEPEVLKHPTAETFNIAQHWASRQGGITAPIDYRQTRTIDVPSDLLRENRIIAGMEADLYTNAYKILRSQVLQHMRINQWSTIGVTSAWDGEGKSLTAINLAISLAMEVNYTVLLVDANLRSPAIAQYFGIDSVLEQGLSDCLTGLLTVDQVLVHPTGIDRFVFMPAGGSLINAGEMLSSDAMLSLIAEVRSRYAGRIIVFDLPPTLVAAESLAVASYMDAIMLVAEAGKTTKEDIAQCEDLLSAARILGTVLTKTKHKNKGGPRFRSTRFNSNLG